MPVANASQHLQVLKGARLLRAIVGHGLPPWIPWVRPACLTRSMMPAREVQRQSRRTLLHVKWFSYDGLLYHDARALHFEVRDKNDCVGALLIELPVESTLGLLSVRLPSASHSFYGCDREGRGVCVWCTELRHEHGGDHGHAHGAVDPSVVTSERPRPADAGGEAQEPAEQAQARPWWRFWG
jgi:hypothetical protein